MSETIVHDRALYVFIQQCNKLTKILAEIKSAVKPGLENPIPPYQKLSGSRN